MKITVEIPEDELKDACALTGIKKKGPAIRQLVSETLALRKRAQVAQKFITGEFSTELKGYEKSRKDDRISSQTLATLWLD